MATLKHEFARICYRPRGNTGTDCGLNRQLRGWGNYFKFGYPRDAFRETAQPEVHADQVSSGRGLVYIGSEDHNLYALAWG
jgi:hypothetical protein